MRVDVTGATGNVGTSLVQVLSDDPQVESVLGLARRLPRLAVPKTTWAQADVATSDLPSLFRGADAVVHLAWLIQPSHQLHFLRQVNVVGSQRVFRAVADAGVKVLIHASSVGAYSPGPTDLGVDESWPTEGVPTSFYSRHKAEVERRLDRFESEFPDVRVVRLRPGLIFKRESGSEVRRLFTGPFLPTTLVRPALIPLVPDEPRLRVQAVHSLDVAEAYRLALSRDVRGPFNVAADPVLDPPELARILKARLVPVGSALLRGGAALTWRLRVQPTPPGWVDLALEVPVLDTSRAREDLGWTPRFSAVDALLELLEGIRKRSGLDTPPLSPKSSGPFRWRELRTAVGGAST